MRFDDLATRMFLALVVLAASPLAVADAQQDWTQWRGPDLNSVADVNEEVVDELNESTTLWRTDLPGPAGSSPVVAAGRVFVTSVDGDSLVVLCVDAASGKELWRRTVDGANEESRDGANAASSSPCTDGKHVWTMFGNGQVNCFTIDGDEVWAKDLQKEYGTFQIQFGMSTTPVLHDGQLLYGLMHGKMRNNSLTSVGKIVALDAATGKENWLHVRKTDATFENKHVYTSPSIAKLEDRSLLIIHGADYTTAHSMEDGDEVWRLGGMNPQGDAYHPTLRMVASATFNDGMLIVPSAKRGPVWAVDPDRDGTLTKNELEWASPKVTPDVASPVFSEEIVFLAREKGTLACLDSSSGEKLVEKRYMADNHRSTPVAVDGKLVITDRSGKVILVKADQTLEKLSSIDLGEQITASPAVSRGKIFVRTFKALYAFGDK